MGRGEGGRKETKKKLNQSKLRGGVSNFIKRPNKLIAQSFWRRSRLVKCRTSGMRTHHVLFAGRRFFLSVVGADGNRDNRVPGTLVRYTIFTVHLTYRDGYYKPDGIFGVKRHQDARSLPIHAGEMVSRVQRTREFESRDINGPNGNPGWWWGWGGNEKEQNTLT